MHRILLLGAGKMGETITHFLASTGDFDLLVGDASAAALQRIGRIPGVKTVEVEAGSTDAVAAVLRQHQCETVISACSFDVNVAIANAALLAGASYFDLTEDVQTTRAIKLLADSISPALNPGCTPGASPATRPSRQIFMPQCGLAPGFVAIAAYDLARQFDSLDSLRLRVGALPIFPTNAMKYNLTWSTDGLINEYGNPCQAIYEGRLIDVLPLEGLEHFSLDGLDYEAFNTSGAIGTLPDTLAGQVRSLDYKTIRYRGHRDLIAFLMNELRLNTRRALLKDILENSIPITPQDLVLIFCTAEGIKDGRLTQITDARKIYHGEFLGHRASAIQITTSAAICAVVDLHATGKLPATSGFVRQEQVALADFLDNRFGRAYAGTETISGNVRFEPWTRRGSKTSGI